jgi:hypothetical protein
MQNTNPKSDLPAIKEKAAKDKDREARQQSIDNERKSCAGRYEPTAGNNTAKTGAQNCPITLGVSNARANVPLGKEGASNASA